MTNDTKAIDTKLEPNSLGGDYMLYSDWVSANGSTIEVSINTKIWPKSLVANFQPVAIKLLDNILSELGSGPTSVSLYLCDNAKMQQLNREHRQIDKPTNVLSFAAYNIVDQKVEWFTPQLIGDIVIAAEIVACEAEGMQIPVADHLTHLFVHAMLHLFGYDHVEDNLAEAMEALEVKFLKNIGISNPYQDVQMETYN